MATKKPTISFSKADKWILFTYFSCFILLGFVVASPGPMLGALQEQVDVSLATISWIFFARGIGYSLGGFLAGVEQDHYGKYLLKYHNKSLQQRPFIISSHQYFGISIFITIICLIIIPFINNVILLSIIVCISGICFGHIDTLGNVCLLALFDSDNENDERVGPYMQFLHFCFGIGAFLSPLLIEFSFFIDNKYDIAYFIMAALFFPFGILLIWFLKTPQRHSMFVKEENKDTNTSIATNDNNNNNKNSHASNNNKNNKNSKNNKNNNNSSDNNSTTNSKSKSSQPKSSQNLLDSNSQDDINSAKRMTQTIKMEERDPTINDSDEEEDEELGNMKNLEIDSGNVRNDAIMVGDELFEEDGGIDLAINVEKQKLNCIEYIGSLTKIQKYEYLSMLLFATFLGVYVGSEVGYGAYIHTFCVNYHSILTSESTGRYMTSMFWGSLSFGRLCAVYLSKHIKPLKMLIYDLIGCMIASIILLFLNDNIIYIWIASGIYGFSMASQFPAIFLVAESTVKVSGKLASFMVFGASVGEFLIPALEGNIMAHVGVGSFIGTTFVLTCLMIFVLITIILAKRKLPS